MFFTLFVYFTLIGYIREQDVERKEVTQIAMPEVYDILDVTPQPKPKEDKTNDNGRV